MYFCHVINGQCFDRGKLFVDTRFKVFEAKYLIRFYQTEKNIHSF